MNDHWVDNESHVDWITATCRQGSNPQRLLEKGLEIVGDEYAKGHDRKDWNFQGYRGTHAAGASAGWRMDGSIVRLSGAVAGLRWRDIFVLATNVSRIDLCVTARAGTARRDLAEEAYRAAIGAAKRGGAPSHFTLFISSGGGETLYCNRRISERFGRMYRKDVESEGVYPEGTYRWEVEYKGGMATQAVQAITSAPDSNQRSAELVEAEFRRWHVPFVPRAGQNCSNALAGLQRPTDNAKRMEWLATHVASSIEKMSTSYSEEEILRALGLWHKDNPKPVMVSQVLGQHEVIEQSGLMTIQQKEVFRGALRLVDP